MCISETEADAIRILMHSQRYDTLKMYMKQLAMRFDSAQCNGKNMITFIESASGKPNHLTRRITNVSNALNGTNIFAVCHGDRLDP